MPTKATLERELFLAERDRRIYRAVIRSIRNRIRNGQPVESLLTYIDSVIEHDKEERK